MKALVFHGPKDIRYDTAPDPTPEDAASAIVQVERCGICGSDLHIYDGPGFGSEPGFCVGHESVGEVMEVGSEVQRFKPGDKVMVSAAVGCATCPACRSGNVLQCEQTQVRCFGVGNMLQGSQAQAVAVPAADSTLHLIPEGLTTEQALMLTDNLPTACFGVDRAEIQPGETVGVVGVGPIGLLAAELSKVMGAARVIAIDKVQDRLSHAEELGAIPVHADEAHATVGELTKGKGLDRVIEAAGVDATIHMAMQLVRQEGTVSAIGVTHTMNFDFPMALAFMKSISFRIGLCPIQRYWPTLIPLIQSGRLQPERVITHRMNLSEGEDAYRIFSSRTEGVLKVAMDPAA